MKAPGRGWRLVMPFLALMLLLGSGTGPTSTARAAPPAPKRYVAGVLLVKRKAGVSAEAVARQARGAAVAEQFAALGVDKVAVTPGQEEAVARQLEQAGLVEYAQPDYLYRVADVTPNDPDYPMQWDFPRIEAPKAWETTMGSPSATVAVIDTGYYLAHPDKPVNLVAGPTYTQGSAPYENPPCGTEGVGGPNDDFGHGTHVGGTIAAATNNSIGVAGLAPNVKLLVIKAGDCAGSFDDDDIGQAVQYAVNAGARVINMSFGGPGPDPFLASVMQNAWNRGVVLVAAAGNQGTTGDFVPADLPGVMAVSATNETDAVASFSNYGPWVAVAAPGVDIYSTAAPTDQEGCAGQFYCYKSGTSMASPHVAAVAGLILSAYPDLSNAQVVSAIEQGAVPLGAGVPNQQYGYGRLDACLALRSAQRLAGPAATGPGLSSAASAHLVFLPVVASHACL